MASSVSHHRLLFTASVMTLLRCGTVADNASVPGYMLELFASKHHFGNVRNYATVSGCAASREEKVGRASNLSVVEHLVFNITTLPIEERLQMAQLKLWTRARSTTDNSLGVRRLIQVYLTNGHDYNPRDLELLDFKYALVQRENWMTFNVTHAVRWWMDHNILSQVLLVRVDVVHPSDLEFGSIDISWKEKAVGNGPQLVIYSSPLDINILDNNVIRHTIKKRGTPKRFKHHKIKSMFSFCHRQPLYVNFTAIHYDRWIIAPAGFQAYECVGRCDFPLSDHTTPSKHAIIQSLMNSVHPKKVAKPCCVPTRLQPISLLYIDQLGVLTYKYSYDDMVVVECGCR